jgi:hypothetical protein
MTDDEREKTIQAAARVLMRAALAMLQKDPHSWSTRPCQTCQAVSAIAGEPFGCSLVAQQPRRT